MTTLSWVCQAVLLVSGAYGLYHCLIALPVVGGLRQPAQLAHRINRFAVLVFAKDEAVVIEPLLASLRSQEYPTDAFEIFVTADNCTDDTAARSRAGGATVWERQDTERVGKGFALDWFFERFAKQRAADFDACVMFDADNLAAPGFLAAMNRQLNAGVPIAVGYRMGKNPTSSWVAGVSSLFWLVQTRMFHLPRARRGLPVLTVGGTGWMFSLDVVGKGGWKTTSVCEDIEFTMNAIAEGSHVGLAMDALFYDEQPLTFAQSMKQRYRWSLGCLQVLDLVGRKLLRAVRMDWHRSLDALLFSLGIPITAVSAIAGTIGTIATAASTGMWQLLIAGLLASALVSYTAIVLVAAWVLRLERVRWRGDWQAVLAFPIYVVSWSLINTAVLFYRNPAWKTIPHVDAVEIGDLQTPTDTPAPNQRRIPLQDPVG